MNPIGALEQRLGAAAHALGVDGADDAPDRLLRLLARCRDSEDVAETWLVMVCTTASWPAADEVRMFHGRLRDEPLPDLLVALLDVVAADPRRGAPELEADVVAGGVVVVADFCARHDYNSGIQRTVRETLPRWERAGHEFVTTAYTTTTDGLRTLDPVERGRVFAYGSDAVPASGDPAARLVVPWQGMLLLPEVPVGPICRALAGAAELSGNLVSGVGYDAIRLTSADLRRWGDSELFADHLAVVQHLDRVAAISESSRVEFAGFADLVAARGGTGPDVVEVVLPAQAPSSTPQVADPPVLPHTPGRVQVLCVGAKEIHKNQRAVLHAAERLWREGLDFDLTFIGARGWTPEGFEAAFDRLAATGRPVRHLGRLSDELLDAAYREADVTVFLSLHEGYGLPAAESLSCGTPVLTSDFGSLAEIAADGGAMLADPRDDEVILVQLRRLVAEPELRERLAHEARDRPVRTWDDYAAELWPALTEVTR